MQPTALIDAVARTQDADRLARAEVLRSLAGSAPAERPRRAPEVTIRFARHDDAPVLERLAELDGHHRAWVEAAPREVLVAVIAGELVAAHPVDGGPVIADPFRPTAELLAILDVRAGQLTAPARRGHGAMAVLRPRAF